MDKDYQKLLKLLDTDLTESNDEEQLNQLQDLMGSSPTTPFSIDFTNEVMDRIEDEKGEVAPKDDELMNKLVYMFKRVALSGAAAILLLVAYTWVNDGSVSTDALLGISYLEDTDLDFSYAFNDSF